MLRPLLRIKTLFMLFFVLFYLNASAQSPVKGVVKDDTGVPLPGATVKNKNTNAAVATKYDGTFSIAASPRQILEVTSLGFVKQEITVGRSDIIVRLKPESTGLNEVVVVGYGSTRKRDFTGAISTVSAEDVSGRHTVQVSDALEGAIPGVTVTRNGAAPGAQSTIRFRGITTIGTNDPLIIVDGVPSLSIDKVNPEDVESITALKDASSTAIYGSRAAAGVILVTTKRGKLGQATVDYNYEYGTIRPYNLPKYAGPEQYMKAINEYLLNDASSPASYVPAYTQSYIDSYQANHAANPNQYPITDWQGDVLKGSAPRQTHNLAFMIGSDKIKTRASIGYSNTQGLYDNRDYKKYNVTLNNDFKFNEKLSAVVDIALIQSVNDQVNASSAGGIIYDIRLLPPILYADRWNDGRLAPGKDGRNPLAAIEQGGFNTSQFNTINARAAINYKPVSGLTLTGIVAPSYVFARNKTFSKVINFTDANDPSKTLAVTNQANTTLLVDRPYTTTFNAQLLANYIKTFDRIHNIDLVAGYEDNYNYTEDVQASRGSFLLTSYPYLSDGLLTLRDNSESASEYALRSYFGRFSYNFKNKYYLQLGGRYDGSSRFAAEHRWGFFPSVGAGWTVSEEPFFKNLKGVSFLKFRGSWGQSGNERIGNYPYQSNITLNTALLYKSGIVDPVPTGGQIDYSVESITWETQQTTNLGFDAAFLDSRLTVTGDVYTKETKNILLQLNIPIYLGFSAPYQNAGRVGSKGWEIAANWSDRIGDWKYSFGFNVSDAKTKVIDLKGTSILGDQANIEGQEFNAWYGYRSQGLFQTTAEVSSSPLLSATTKPGDVKYLDINGDGKISADKDKVALGGSLPRYTFGINGKLDYKNFTLSFVANGVGKQLVRLNSVAVQPLLENFGNIPSILIDNYWSTYNTAEQNLAAKYPRLSRISDNNNYQMSDYWLVSGQYFRMKNITLGYSLPSSFFKNIGVKGLRVYAACNDAFTLFSKFPPGSDPEVDAVSYPIVRTFFAGASIKF